MSERCDGDVLDCPGCGGKTYIQSRCEPLNWEAK
jgi:hypothetical protein